MSNSDQDDVDPSWPNAASHIFGHRASTHFLNVDLGYLQGDERLYEIAYREAVDILYRQAIQEPSACQWLILPLGYLWRHTLELQLKMAIARSLEVAGRDLDKKERQRLHVHKLLPLWQLTKEQIEAIGVSTEPLGVEDFERLLGDVDALDPEATGFRFHAARNGEPSLSPRDRSVDLENFHKVFCELYTFVDCLNEELKHIIVDGGP